MADTVKVKVIEGWAVYDGEQQRTAPATIEVDSDTADQWIVAGWVEKVQPTKAKVKVEQTKAKAGPGRTPRTTGRR